MDKLVSVLLKSNDVVRVERDKAEQLVNSKKGNFISKTTYKALSAGLKLKSIIGLADRQVKDKIFRKLNPAVQNTKPIAQKAEQKTPHPSNRKKKHGHHHKR